jgi:acetyltransferase-like isoleucine patch superfamily enzyme
MMHSKQAQRIGALFAAGAFLVAGASCSSSKSAKKDVKIVSCQADSGGGKPTAAGTIVNHSSKTSAYTVHVKFYDSSGNAVGDGVSVVASVDPDKTAHWDTKGTVNAKGPVTCKLDSVTRNVSV